MKPLQKTILLALLIMCILISACGTISNPQSSVISTQSPDIGNVDANKSTPDPVETSQPLSINQYEGDEFYENYVDSKEFLVRYLTKNESELNVPVYWYDDLINKTGRLYCRDFDYETLNSPNTGGNNINRILTLLPTKAARCTDGGKYMYLMYDTDKGQRLFLFSNAYGDNPNEFLFLSGVAVLMQERLSYSSFLSVKKGDSIDSLIEIDPAMEIYSEYLHKNYSKDNLDRLRDAYGPPVTVSILTDGAVKITYEYRDGEFLVDTVEYSEDYILSGRAEPVCYRIAEIDYVD